MARYTNDYTLVFAVKGAGDSEGNSTTASELRTAILARLAALSDDELLEAVGLPVNSFAESNEAPKGSLWEMISHFPN